MHLFQIDLGIKRHRQINRRDRSDRDANRRRLDPAGDIGQNLIQ